MIDIIKSCSFQLVKMLVLRRLLMGVGRSRKGKPMSPMRSC